MKRQSIQERVAGVIEDRRRQLTKEIEEWEQKMRDTEAWYGFGGPYMRQEEARDRRVRELEELENFAGQQQRIRPHFDVHMNVLYCRGCGNVVMSLLCPSGEWHECPHCKKMMYDNEHNSREFTVEDKGQSWLELLKEGQHETY